MTRKFKNNFRDILIILISFRTNHYCSIELRDSKPEISTLWRRTNRGENFENFMKQFISRKNMPDKVLMHVEYASHVSFSRIQLFSGGMVFMALIGLFGMAGIIIGLTWFRFKRSSATSYDTLE